MSKTMIITDTCCDLPAGLVDCYDVEILSIAFSIDDKVFTIHVRNTNIYFFFIPMLFFEVSLVPF